MKARILTLVIAVLGVVLSGCSEEMLQPVREEKSKPPALPPVETMQFDFSFFKTAGDPSGQLNAPLDGGETMTKHNWLNAAVRVIYLDLAVAVAFGPAVLAFQSAIHTTPIVEEDGTFLWTYTWTEPNGHEVVIHLRGRIEGVTIHWNLRVTDEEAQPPLDEFLWFYGESSPVNQFGFWVFNDIDEAKEHPVARIDWDRHNVNDRILAFENIHKGAEDYGDKLTYRVEGAIVSVVFIDASEGEEYNIAWDQETGEGSLQVPDYNNGERACWDENQEDIECPDGPAS